MPVNMARKSCGGEIVITLVCLQLALLGAKEFDPCHENLNLDSTGRSFNLTSKYGEKVSDSAILESWYKFSDCGSKMPEKCVEPERCGSQFPIWMNGTHPTEDNPGPKEISVCSSGGQGLCCSWNTSIKVKLCANEYGRFFVYKLKPTEASMSYCVRKPAICEANEYYDEEKETCLSIEDELLPKPILSDPSISDWKIVKVEDNEFNATKYSFECSVDLTVLGEQRSKVEKIEFKFTADGEDLVTFTTTTNLTRVYLEEENLLGRFWQEISCLVRYRLKSHPCFSDQSSFTVWSRSNAFKHTIKILTEEGNISDVLDFYENDFKTFRLVSNFPMTSAICYHAPGTCQKYFALKVAENSVDFVETCFVTFELDGGFLSLPFQIEAHNFKSIEAVSKLSFVIATNKPWIYPENLRLSFDMLVHKERRLYCLLSFDHQLSGFRGITHGLSGERDFELLTNGLNFQVQVRQTFNKEDPRVPYTCAVAMRSYNEILIVSVCGGQRVPRFARILSSKYWTASPEIFAGFEIQSEKGFYKIIFHSANTVVVSMRHVADYTSLNVHILPRSEVKYFGMCADPLPSESLTEEESLFSRDLKKFECGFDYRPTEFCYCITENPMFGQSSVICELREMLNENLFTLPMCHSGYMCSGDRVEYIPNSAEPQCSPKDILPSQYLPKSSHKHLMFPTHASKLDILETEKVQDMLRGCSKDIERAGHPYIGRLIMNIFEESCLIELSLGRWDNLALLDMIRNSTCINRCTERGHCKSGVCECEEGYVNKDCSTKNNSIPSIEQILPDSCDSTTVTEIGPTPTINCSAVYVYANDAHGEITCRLQPLGACKGSLNKEQIVPGKMILPGLIVCHFPELKIRDPGLLMTEVSLSNDKVNYSPSKAYTYYSGSCVSCTNAEDCSYPEDIWCAVGGTKCHPKNKAFCAPVKCH